jgi:hypothetical protein
MHLRPHPASRPTLLAPPFLLRDVEVHHILGGILEVAELLLQTCIANGQVQ